MKRKALVVLPMVAMLSACTFYQTQSAVDDYLKGQLAVQRENLPAALSHLSEAIKKNPRMTVALVARAELLKKQGNYDDAARDLESATRLEPYNYDANYQLGIVYQYLKRFADAVRAFSRAAEIRPADPETNMNLALSYLQNGEPFRGLPFAQRAIQFNERSATAHANIGVIYSHVGLSAEAVNAFKRSLELDSKQPEVYAQLAQEYLNDRKFDQARNVLETASVLAPSAKVWDRLGYALHMLRDEEKANTAFNESLRLDGSYFPALNGLGVVAMTKALSKSPTDVDLAKEAIGYWKQSLAINPNQESIRHLVNTYAPQQ